VASDGDVGGSQAGRHWALGSHDCILISAAGPGAGLSPWQLWLKGALSAEMRTGNSRRNFPPQSSA